MHFLGFAVQVHEFVRAMRVGAFDVERPLVNLGAVYLKVVPGDVTLNEGADRNRVFHVLSGRQQVGS